MEVRGWLLLLLTLTMVDREEAFGQAADLVLTCPGGCSDPHAISIDPTTDELYLADTGNARVLRYGPVGSLTSTSMPLAVFGQKDFVSNKVNQIRQMHPFTMLGI